MRDLASLGISPTPWVLEEQPYGSWITDQRGRYLSSDDGEFPNPADARLIAAAPDCLMSLCEVLAALKNRLPSQPTLEELKIINRAEAAIRKATGESEGESK